ncbi:MAG TPA: acetate/propionate family kinase [Burkholderiaceae bacterium]|nr:acetate/propionate family kinase [Burkholderiaceae bacterium]
MSEVSVVTVNAGSSSLKFCRYRLAGDGTLHAEARGAVEGIGSAPRIAITNGQDESLVKRDLSAAEVRDPSDAVREVARWLQSHFQDRAAAVGHRFVHGGADYAAPVALDAATLERLRAFIPLAPLHQPFNIAAVEAAREYLPGVPQVACFDTAFHNGHAEVARLIPLPWKIYESGVRRYGFHGLSYEYIASVLPQVAPEIARGRVIVAHLGSGASLCALREGRSVDSTLGFTALDGVCMGTRPGAVDPGAILYLFQELGLSAKDVEGMLYKQSGLLGISGVSNDMRALLASDAPRARLAIEFFVYRIAKEIGALAAALEGLDGVVFTAGIGERSAEIRKRICESSAWLGVTLDGAANEKGGPRISTPGSKVSAWTIPTDEELMIARHTCSVLGLAAD